MTEFLIKIVLGLLAVLALGCISELLEGKLKQKSQAAIGVIFILLSAYMLGGFAESLMMKLAGE